MTDLSGASQSKPANYTNWWNALRATIVAYRETRAKREAEAQANMSFEEFRRDFAQNKGCPCNTGCSCTHLARDIFPG